MLWIMLISCFLLLTPDAFCRCLQIERMLPEGYSNVGFLYTSLSAFDSSEETMNALTQVAEIEKVLLDG